MNAEVSQSVREAVNPDKFWNLSYVKRLEKRLYGGELSYRDFVEEIYCGYVVFSALVNMARLMREMQNSERTGAKE